MAEERAGLLPRVDVAAGVLDYGVLGRDHTLEWQAGLRLSWPIFTGGGRRALVRQARADVTAAQGELAATELRVADEVDAAATAATEADARARALQAAVAQWTEVARIERLALDAGSGVQRDLLAAQAGLFEARAGHATAINDAVLARVRLAKAQGVLDRRWITAVLEVAR